MNKIVLIIANYIIPSFFYRIRNGYRKISQKNTSLSKIDIIRKGMLIINKSNIDYKDDYVRQFSIIVKKLNVNKEYNYIYPYNPMILRMLDSILISSITVDYGKILDSNINTIRCRIEKCCDQSFKNRELKVLDSIEFLSKIISKKLSRINDKRSKDLSILICEMLYRKPLSFDEALQKILFYNALFWQMEHYHIGLGRLDLILNDYYESDIKRGIITRSEAKEMLKDFILILGKNTNAKSPRLIGDTGQYILLGGIDSTGNNVSNNLTELFIDLFIELKIPDPKLILRVNQNTPDRIWHKAVQCIMTGIGSPLIMNESVIMDKMIKFGYDSKDVWNVGTSACWEPLIIGKSFDQNNPFRSIVAIKSLNDAILSGNVYSEFRDLLKAYKAGYKSDIEKVISDINFDCSPLFTLFFDYCIDKEKDYTDGGAVYSYHGALVVSLPNTINALLNIKKLVYEDQLYSLNDCRQAINSNFENMEEFRTLLTTAGKKFGSTDKEVVDLTNEIIGFTSDVVKRLNCNGQRIKVGFSSPNYIQESKVFMATLDGRKKGEPFAVHISPISSKIDISEILDFASLLDYDSNCINGNVVDFIIPSLYIKQTGKLVGILKNACSKGIFELQLNVMDKAILLDAKAHPDKYPNLIVRVWGFSAYFNDLPEEYKDNLIRRAEIYEIA